MVSLCAPGFITMNAPFWLSCALGLSNLNPLGLAVPPKFRVMVCLVPWPVSFFVVGSSVKFPAMKLSEVTSIFSMYVLTKACLVLGKKQR